MLQDELAVACIMPIELKPRLVCNQRLEQRLALEERQVGDVPTANMQEIKGIIDQMHTAFAVGRCLSVRKARQPLVVEAAELAVEIGGLHVDG